MKTNLFSFNLPDELIAQEPPRERGTCRLMVLDPANDDGSYDEPYETTMPKLPDLIEPGTLMVFNDTKVRKSRLFAENAETGGKGEFLFLRPSPDGSWDCLVDKAKKKRVGQRWLFPGDIVGTIVGTPASDRRLLSFEPDPPESWFETHGHMPLPPYMRRPDNASDEQRYQTVYAKETGSAAAPTAGLHFTEEILKELGDRNIEIAWLTLEVGLGTFSPVRTENIEEHPMHHESYFVPEATADSVRKARAEGRKVLAVGTTSVRTLEAAWNAEKGLTAGRGETNLFIFPGYEFKAVDQIFTNFHTPESSLLMLVSAFCGRERLLEAYESAVNRQFKFFSYGDAMLLR